MKKKWLGQTKCNFCGDDVQQHKDFFDGRTIHGRSWALMCDSCFTIHGIGVLGTGYGQKYDGKTLQKIGG